MRARVGYRETRERKQSVGKEKEGRGRRIEGSEKEVFATQPRICD
jgi:hypothetical protein